MLEQLGTPQEKAARQPEVNRVKGLMGSDFFRSSMEERQRRGEEIIDTFGMQGIRTVDDLFNREQAPGYNRDRATQTLLILSTAVYENMNENGLQHAPIAGTYTVESLLPPVWIGNDAKEPINGSRFSSMVTQHFIDNFGDQVNQGQAFSALESVDLTRNNPKPDAEAQRQDEIREASFAAKAIRQIVAMGRGAMGAKRAALEYLESIGGREDPNNNIERVVSALSSERAESTYNTFVTAEFLQQPIQLQVDTFPPSWFRNVPENFHGSLADWQQVIRARINITNAAYIKAEVAAIDGEKAKNNNFLKLSEKELKIMYEMEGVRESMEQIVQDFFQLERDEFSGAYFLELKATDRRGSDWTDRLSNFKGYQEGLVRDLIRNRSMQEDDARGAVAMAWNFLYISNVFESADSNREMGGGLANVFGEQIRAMMHPLSKARAKFVKGGMDERSHGTEEGWGGNVGAWFADMLTWEDTRADFTRRLNSGELKPFPRRIGASMIDMMEVKVESGDRMSLARALMESRKVEFNRADSNLFGEYCDKWDTFFKYYYYSTGKNLLDIKKNLNEWSNGLADVLAKTRSMRIPGGAENSQLFRELDTPEAFAWIMLNSIGIVRSPELMLEVSEEARYGTVVDMVLQQPRLVPNRQNRETIKRMLHGGWNEGVRRQAIKIDSYRRHGRAPEGN